MFKQITETEKKNYWQLKDTETKVGFSNQKNNKNNSPLLRKECSDVWEEDNKDIYWSAIQVYNH